MPRFRTVSVMFLAVAAILACRDSGNGNDDRPTGGTVVISTGADAPTLMPPLSADQVSRAVVSVTFDKLAEIGPDLNTIGDQGYEPRLARRWTWAPDSLSITFEMDPAARWHDGRPVTARDVVLGFDIVRDPATGAGARPLLTTIDSVTARDSMTVVVWYGRRSPEQFFQTVYHVFPLPSHLLADADRATLRAHPTGSNPVGSGPFKLRRWERGSLIEVVANADYYRGRPPLDRVIWRVAPDPTTGFTRVLSGESDWWEIVLPNQMADVANNPDLRTVPYNNFQYGHWSFNLRDPRNRERPHPIFADRGVRRALTMAIDRRRLAQSVWDSLGTVGQGPFSMSLATGDSTLRQIPHDVEGAKRLLDSLGWRDSNGDGVREKNGRPLEFGVMAPTSSAPRIRYAVLLQEALRQVGAKLNVEQLEFTTMGARMDRRAFDSYLGVWASDPSPSGFRQTWTTSGADADGANVISYQNPTVDALIDSALASMDPATVRAYYRRAYQLTIDDAPAVWLYEPRLYAVSHQRIRTSGSDGTSSLRADGWFYGIPAWYIPEDERIERDRIGLPESGGRDTAGASAGGAKTP